MCKIICQDFQNPTTITYKMKIMKSKIAQTIIAGLIATAVMTIVGLMAPYIGLPKINPAAMLSAMMGSLCLLDT